MAERRFWNNNKIPPSGERVMTEETLDYLRKSRESLQDELQELGLGTEGGHQRAQIHDSATLESHKNVLREKIGLIGDLSSVSILRPREVSDRVFLGNKVRILIEGEESPEDFTLLGPDDVSAGIEGLAPGTTVISYKSPLGAALVGHSTDESISYKIREKLVRVQILSVETGNFGDNNGQ